MQKTEENSLLSHIQIKELTKTVPQENKSNLWALQKLLLLTQQLQNKMEGTPEQNK